MINMQNMVPTKGQEYTLSILCYHNYIMEDKFFSTISQKTFTFCFRLFHGGNFDK